MARGERAELKEVGFSWFGVSAKWVADRAQMDAAWAMYVELVTRIAIQPFDAEHAILREALTSLHTLIAETRRILKQSGPGVARPARPGSLTFAAIAVDVVNREIRPFLTRWHPALLAHESKRAVEADPVDHERGWTSYEEACRDLEVLRGKLVAYAKLLAEAADVPEEGLPSELRAART